ncbi:hypothetical protein DERF_007823 [Dermatophagoides farinae]|uniref:Uncharacterized protein n=1 Tax=Dermatophagoides farinae TaxID=6954 RepID=A0A922I1W8_DERFA|nr:hypothetical protein DERF_007823 [Dermatophagoides farinae]
MNNTNSDCGQWLLHTGISWSLCINQCVCVEGEGLYSTILISRKQDQICEDNGNNQFKMV